MGRFDWSLFTAALVFMIGAAVVFGSALMFPRKGT